MNKKLGNFLISAIVVFTMCSIADIIPVSASEEVKRSESSYGSNEDIENNIQPYYMTKAEWEQYKKDGPINEDEGTNGFNPLAKGLRVFITKSDGTYAMDLTWGEYKKLIGINATDGDYIILSKRYVSTLSRYNADIRAYDKDGKLKIGGSKDGVGTLARQWDTPIEPKYGWNEFIYHTWCYFDENGWATSTWKKINGNWYYFTDHSKMANDWQKINGLTYHFTNGIPDTGWKFIGHWYYFYGDCTMATNTTIDGYTSGADGIFIQ